MIDVARAYIIYRQRRAELRAAKALLGVRDELKLSLAAVTVLSERYLRRDGQGRPVKSTSEVMDRTASFVAAAEDDYRAGRIVRTMGGQVFRAAARPGVSAQLADPDECWHSGRRLSACEVLPLEDSLRSIFTTRGMRPKSTRPAVAPATPSPI